MDRTTKLLLAAIAIGLFLNAGINMVRTANADEAAIRNISDEMSSIANAMSSIAKGTCKNSKLC